jgi:hypothetical protein
LWGKLWIFEASSTFEAKPGMPLLGLVVVFIMILVVLYVSRFPIPPSLLWIMYALISGLLIVILLQTLGLLGPGPAMRITP